MILDIYHQIADGWPIVATMGRNPWVLAYVGGILTGWHAARRTTRYMLGGRA